MAELQPTDEFLVNRNDITYTQETDTLMASLETTDYLLVNRSDATYKITGEDFINSVIDPLEVTVIISPNPPLIRDNAEAIPVVTGGKQPDGGYVFTYQWHYADDLLGTNKVDIPGQTASTYDVPESDITKFIGCTVTTTDALNTTTSGTGYGGPVSAVEIAPVIDEVILTEIYDGENRFTDKEFPYTTVMGLDGTPDPTFAVKTRLSGTTFNFNVESDTITKVEGAGENVYTTDTIASVDALNLTVTGWTTPENAVDGDDSTKTASVNNTPGIITFSSVQTGVTKVRAKTRFYGAGASVGGTAKLFKDGAVVHEFNLAVGEGTKYYTIYDGPAIEFDQYWQQMAYSDSSDDFWALEINNVIVTDGPTTTTLTFPTDNNFDKFEVGDVVQNTGLTNCTGIYIDDVFKIVDGVTPENFYVSAVKINGKILADSNGTNTIDIGPYTDNATSNSDRWHDGNEAPEGTAEFGSYDTYWRPAANGRANLYWTTPIDIETFEIQCTIGAGGQGSTVSIKSRNTNDLLFETNTLTAKLNWRKTTIEGTKITAIDDTVPSITVDGGSWYGQDGSGDDVNPDWNQSQEWSTDSVLLSGSYGDSNGNTPDKAFDGDLNTVCNTTVTGFTETTFATPITNVTSLRIYGRSGRQEVDPTTLKINNSETDSNGQSYSSDYAAGTDVIWRTITNPPSTLSSIYWGANSTGNAAVGINAIEVNGKILVDTSVPDGQGDTVVTKTVAYETKLTVASDKDLDVITGGIYMTDGTPKQDGSGELEPASYTPQTSTIASVGSGGILTSITSIAGNTPGSSAISAIYIDGVILTNSGAGSVTEGAFSSDGRRHHYCTNV